MLVYRPGLDEVIEALKVERYATIDAGFPVLAVNDATSVMMRWISADAMAGRLGPEVREPAPADQREHGAGDDAHEAEMLLDASGKPYCGQCGERLRRLLPESRITTMHRERRFPMRIEEPLAGILAARF